MIRTLRLHYHFAGASYGDLLAAWLLTEPMLAELAAQNPDRDLVREMMEPFLGTEAEGDVKAAGSSFHEAVGQLSGNPVLEIMFRAMATTMENHIVDAVRQADFDDEIVDEHSELAKAIIDGDGPRARALMASHIENITGYFREFLPRIVGETVPPARSEIAQIKVACALMTQRVVDVAPGNVYELNISGLGTIRTPFT